MIDRFVRAWGGAGIEHPRRTLLLAGLAVLLVVPGLLRIRVHTDLSSLLARSSEASEGLALAVQGITSSDAIYALLEARGEADPHLLVDVGGRIAAAWESDPRVVRARTRPAEGLPATDPRRVFDVAEGETRQALLERLSDAGIARRIGQLKQLLMGPTGAENRKLLLADPLGLLPLLGEHVARGTPRLDAGGEGFVAPDGRALLLVVDAVDDSGDYHAAFLEDLRRTALGVLAEHPEGDQLQLGITGAWMHALTISETVKRDATALSFTSIFAVLLLYLGFYRSLRSLGLVFAVLPWSAIVTVGLGGYLMGPLNPLAAGCLAIMFGLGVDPAIHLISRYREARIETGVVEAGHEALASVGPAVLLASGTTAAALFAMAAAEPHSLGQMGVLSGIGVSLNALAMLAVLPALWTLAGERIAPDPGVGVEAARRFARLLQRRGRVIVGVLSGLALAVLILAPAARWDTSLSGFQPMALEPVRVDHALQEHFGEDPGRLMIVLRGTDPEAVLQANDAWAQALAALEAEGLVTGVESLAVLRPSQARAAERRAALVAARPMAQVAAATRRALVEQGFRPEPFEPALALLADPSRAGEGAAPQWVQWYETKHLSHVDGEVRVVTRVHGAGLPRDTAAALRRAAPPLPVGVQSYVTGLALVEAEAEVALRATLPRLLAAAFLAVLGVLALRYRRVALVAQAAAPLAASLALFVALPGLLGWPLSPMVLAAIPLLAGVGIDDLLFLLDRHIEGGGRLEDTLAGAGRAITVTTLTTLAGFGVLALSRFEALAVFGVAVVIALALAFISSVVVLPALLAGADPGGRLAERD